MRDAVRTGLVVLAMGVAALFAAAQQGATDMSGCLGSSDRPCIVMATRPVAKTVIHVARYDDGDVSLQQAQPTVPMHIQAYPPNPNGIPCAGCSPSSAAAVEAVGLDPASQSVALRCAQAYQNASFAIDDVYGLIPGVSRDEQLVDSIALSDAAQMAAQDPKAEPLLCPVDKIEELEQLTAALVTSRDRLQSDSEAHERADVRNRAAGAVRDMKRWLP
jgi:hypothetical protein